MEVNMEFLKKQITVKRSVGKILLEEIIRSISFVLILYFTLIIFSKNNQLVLESGNGTVTALEFSLIILPLIILISLAVRLAIICFKKKK